MFMKTYLSLAFGVALTLLISPALAHTGVNTVNDFYEGILHPLLGIDHLLVMFAVGLWAGLQHNKAAWLVPVGFLSAMSIGAFISQWLLAPVLAEAVVMLSVLVLGVVIWRQVGCFLPVAMALVTVFALAHGYVHALEINATASALEYSLGFLLTTAVLQALGMLLGQTLVNAQREYLARGFGAVCTVVGLGLLTGL
jgi:urease accessory protein